MMNSISWENSYRKRRIKQSGQGHQDGRGGAGQNSFASKFLQQKEDDMQGGGAQNQPYSQAGAGHDAYVQNGMGAPPHQYHQPNYYHPNGMASQPYAHPEAGGGMGGGALPPYSQSYPPGGTPNSESPGVQHYSQGPVLQANGGHQANHWRYLDLKNKKQTGNLHTKLLSCGKKQGNKAFCFTSSRLGEGVTTVLTNLADYFRTNSAGNRVLVIDANLKNPNLRQVFNSQNNPYGIVEVVLRQVNLQHALAPVGTNVWFLGGGDQRAYIDGNLSARGFVALLNECRELFDYILIDCPPVLSSADALSIAPAADATFLILQSIKIHKQVALKSMALLQDNECNVGGVILNRVQQVIPGWVYRFL